MRSALLNEPPIVRSDGTMKRDYLYVKDAVNAYLTLAEALHKNPDTHRGQAYNFGLDKPLDRVGDGEFYSANFRSP